MKNRFLIGLRHGLPIGLGYLSVSFAFGIFSLGQGLSIWETLLISMTNLTSAGQLAGVPIIAAGGSLAELAVTQLVINLRYSLMSVSLSQKLHESVDLPHRFAVAFFNTDEVFAVASSRTEPLTKSYLYGLGVCPYLGWSLGTLAGALAGDILPASLTSALGITIYGMFVAIVIPAMRERRATTWCVILAVVLSCAFRYLPLLCRVSSGFAMILCAVAASALLAYLAPLEQEGEA
ncbi:MAG: AzlC family ABC transporter permease [Clostridia bacterium]|nr:AzlC family ABC transporter permease [Clostridia bacterium]MBQ8911180.1 AzlC family ABC transporter permease [Clostridia bacterium]